MTLSGYTRSEQLFIRLLRLLLQPGRLILAIMRRVPLGPYRLRCALDLYPRPHYAYGIQQAAEQARRLGINRISAVEFGVAGGSGLLEMVNMARAATAHTGVIIDVYGFDRASGLPESADYRDLPYIWRAGDFTMDVEALRTRVPEAHLVLGDIEDTVVGFFAEYEPAPVAFVSIDVDLHSSTAAALKMFQGKDDYFLPRVFCYFDDTVGDDDQVLHNEFVGELSAIREFNEENDDMKIASINGLRHKRPIAAPWNDNLYALHRFTHPYYGCYIGHAGIASQLPLQG